MVILYLVFILKQGTLFFSWFWSIYSYSLKSCCTGTGAIDSAATLNDINKIAQYNATTNHNRVWTTCISLAMYYIS